MNILSGKKTYIIAILIGLIKTAQMLGWVSDTEFNTVSTILSVGGLATLRSAIATSSRSTTLEEGTNQTNSIKVEGAQNE